MRVSLRKFRSRIRRRSYLLRQRLQILPLVLLALLFLSMNLAGYHLLLGEGILDHSMARSLLRLGLPNVGYSDEGEVSALSLPSFLYWLTNYNLQDPLSLLEAVLPTVPYDPAQFRVWEERPFVFIQELAFAPDPVRPPVVTPEEKVRVELPTRTAQVLIYHTHSSEMYVGRALPTITSSEAHYNFRNLADPTITGVMSVGRHLANALASFGMKTVHETRIHTLPTINNSYANSEKTVRELLAKNRDFDLVLDVHRDAGVPSPTTRINGRTVARMVIVVGTAEKIPLAHPNFQKNLDLAYRIKAICDEMYPGLMRPVQVQQEARYNQHLHPQSLIIEMGSVENTLEEALLAAELLASVLVRAL